MKNFGDYYKAALKYQAEQDPVAMGKLLVDAAKSGMPLDDLAMLGALAETTLMVPPNGNR